MNEVSSLAEWSCPSCGAWNNARDTRCWLCKKPLPADSESAESRLAESIDARPQFALSTLLLVLTVTCVCVGLVAAAPGLIFPLVVIVVPALIRSAAASRAKGGHATIGDKVASFIISLGIVVGIWTVGLFAFCAALLLICFGGMAARVDQDAINVLFMLAICGLVGALGTMVLLYRVTWPRKRKR